MNPEPPLQQIKPKNARAARALKAREPQTTENPKTTLFLRYTTCSEVAQLLISDLNKLKRPLAIRFTKKNNLHPFEDPSSFEFFAQKNDASLLVFGSHSKKRPHALTFMRMFDGKTLDMIEFLIVPETMRTLSQFKNARKPTVGLKPMLAFCGTPFESPTANAYTTAKSLLLDFFKGEDVSSVDVAGLQYLICVSAEDEVEGKPAPQIHIRCYLIKTKRSGSRLPKVEVEEMGPRVDFRVGRVREADPDRWREAMKRPKGTEERKKKNIETDVMGDKIGRVHLGRQDLGKLQTRKMKGLKRGMEEMDVDGEGDVGMDGVEEDMEGKKRRVS